MAQPTNPVEAEAMIENAMKAMAPAVTTGLEQTWTPSTATDAGNGANNTKGTLSLTGKVTRLTKANLTGSMINGFCAFDNWDGFVSGATSGAITSSDTGYDLLDENGNVKEFGFVVVKIGEADYEMLVVRNAETKKFEVVTRTDGGVLSYHAPRVKQLGGVWYTIDLSGLY